MYSFQVLIIKISHFKHHKSTYTRLLLNFKSLTSFSNKISLIKCLIDTLGLLKFVILGTPFVMTQNTLNPIDKVIKKYHGYNQNQLKTNLTFITLNYHISSTFHTISKINFETLQKILSRKF